MEISSFEQKLAGIKNIDPYVDYELNNAINSYKNEVFSATLLFCGIALEEQLSAIYKIKTDKDQNLKNMRLFDFIIWAVENDIITKGEAKPLHSIRLARNYFCHATRVISEDTNFKINHGKLDEILPDEKTFPNWYLEMIDFYTENAEKEIDLEKPAIGWLDDKETAKNGFEIAIEFVEKTNHFITQSVLEHQP